MTDVTDADFLSRVGKRTPLLVRFSTTAGEKGSSEGVRDVRGMAFKLYTNEGNLDWVFLSQVRVLPRHQVLCLVQTQTRRQLLSLLHAPEDTHGSWANT